MKILGLILASAFIYFVFTVAFVLLVSWVLDKLDRDGSHRSNVLNGTALDACSYYILVALAYFIVPGILTMLVVHAILD
jgi:ABC-type amino acid transport system permease subunit